MAGRLISVARSAYQYPLLIKQLLHAPMLQTPDQQIVYRDLRRLTYTDLPRPDRAAWQTTSRCSVRPGDTVGVMDWDSHRFLEAFFAIPMMGAILQTVNVRLSPEQVTIRQSWPARRCSWVNDEFIGLLQRHQISAQQSADVRRPHRPARAREGRRLSSPRNMRSSSRQPPPNTTFRISTRTRRQRRLTRTGTLVWPKGVYFSHRQLVLHTLAELARLEARPEQGRFHSNDVYMPITPMFHVHAWGFPWRRRRRAVKQVYPGRYAPDVLLKLIKTEGVTFTHGVPTILQMLLSAAEQANVDLSG